MHEDVKRVEMTIPATPEYVVLARLMVAGIASRMGMSYDDIEDLRVMAAEACRLLVGENGRKGTLTFHYAVGPDGIEIDATGHTDPPPHHRTTTTFPSSCSPPSPTSTT